MAVSSNLEAIFAEIAKVPKSEKESPLTYYDGGYGGRLSCATRLRDFFREKSGLDVNWFTSGPANTAPAVFNEEYSGELNFDVLHGPDAGELWLPLKERRRLMRYVPPEAAFLREGTSDPEGYFHHISGIAQVPQYNPERLSPSDLPKSYKELVEPRWKDRILVADTFFLSETKSLLAWLYSKYGPEYIVALANQNPKTATTGREAAELIVKGESDILVNNGAARHAEAKLKGEPLACFLMEEGAQYELTFIGINARTKKPNLSKLFVRYLLSPEAQKIIVEETFDSARTDITTPDWYFPFARYQQEGRMLDDSSPYWLDVKRKYRNIAEKTFKDAIGKTGIYVHQKLATRKAGKTGDGY